MAKSKLDAKEVLDDIRAGMDAVSLMQKYGLSPRGLQSLFGKLEAEGLLDQDRNIVDDWRPGFPEQTGGEKKELSAKSVWVDLKSGMSDNELMAQYKLSEKGLKSLYTKIINAGFIKEYELEQGKPELKRKVKRLLEAGADINKSLYFGCTLLNAAAGAGQMGVVQVLLTKGADVNAPSKNGETPLMKACRSGEPEVARMLLDRGARVDASEVDGVTALMYAAATGIGDLVRLLVDRGADVNAREKNGVTALMMAANEGYPEVVRLLVDHGAEVDAQESEGVTAAMMAAHGGNQDVVNVLLGTGADAQIKDGSGKTASMWAYEGGHREIALTLLKHAKRRQ